jgi:hypothetical protein
VAVGKVAKSRQQLKGQNPRNTTLKEIIDKTLENLQILSVKLGYKG